MAKPVFSGIVTGGLVCFLVFAGYGLGAAKDEIRIGALFAKFSRNTLFSVHVQRLNDGATLFELKPDQLLCPASVTKLVTAGATLTRYSPHHNFVTRFFSKASRSASGVLKGDLYVVGDGDPFVVSEKLWQFAADLGHMGIKEISGDIVIDNSLFDAEVRDESRMVGEQASSHAYDAPVSAFAVNFNTAAVAFAPGTAVGSAAIAELDPYPISQVKIENRLKTGSAKSKDKIDVTRLSGMNGDMKLAVAGSISSELHLKKVYRSVNDPITSSGELLRAFLQGAGLRVKGKIRAGRWPAGAEVPPIYELESYPMGFIVAGLNKFSNNFIADMLVKRLGAEFGSKAPNSPGSGTLRAGVSVLEQFLKEDVGIQTPFILKNGSGLDTANRLSAKQMTKVLSFMERRLDLFPEFLASLPAAGWDGTMNRRFRGDNQGLAGQVRAKTGTLSEPIAAVALAGYFRHSKHGLVSFAILENGMEGRPQPAIGELRDHQDEVIAALVELP